MSALLSVRYTQVWRNQRLKETDYEKACHGFFEEIQHEWAQAYKRMCAARSTKLRIVKHDFTYVFDLTRPRLNLAHEERVVVMFGESRQPTQKREASYMRGFPLPESQLPFRADRGHLGSHGQGGNESGINLIPQAMELNRGWSPQGRLFTEMERYCRTNPGTYFWVRLLYADTSWTPQQLEYGILKPTGELLVRRFDNA